LDDYNSSIIPSGSVLRWSTSNTDLEDETNHLASSIVNIPDTYFGFFFDTITGCFSDVLEVTLTVNTTPSAGTATNIAACSIAANGISVIDLDDQLTGADAGAWSFVNGPAGGSTTINGANEVNFVGQPDGNYTYRYTTNTAIAPCTNEFEDLIITVTECVLPCNAGNISPELNTSLPVDFCDTINVDLNDYVVNTTAPAGTTLTWSTNSDPLMETAHIGSVIFAPGVYHGFFFDAVNGCASPTLDILFTINLTPTISSTTGGVRCGEGTVTLNATSDQVGVSLNWYNVPVGGAILETNTSFTTPIIAATTSFYVEVTSNGCVSERTEVIATVNDQPSAGIPNNTTACDSSDAGISIIDLDTTLSNQDLGIWIFASGPAGISPSIDSDNNVDFNGLPLGDYIFTYTTNIAVSPCTNESIEVTITVIECDNDTDLDGLLDNEEDIIGTDPDNPDTDGDGVQDGQEVNTDNTDPLDDCDSVGGTPLDTSDCDNDGLTTEEENELGTNPNQADTDGDGLTDGEEVLIVDDPSTTAIPESDTDPLDPCDPFLTPDCNPMPIDLLIEKTVDNASPLLGANITFTISVTNLTIDRVIDVTVTDILVNGFVYVSDTASSGIYNQETGAWTIAEIAAAEVVNLEITVTVVSLGLLENTAVLLSSFPLDDAIDNNTATVEINAIESPCTTPGTLCNIFSPNGDGVNDRLIFVDPAGEYNQNRLEIFDRYGNAIFEMQGYDSSWDGTYNNKEVPNGTYFYILDLNGDGTRVTKGWIQIIR